MTSSTDHPLVREYLDAVGRHTAALPAERRRELLADLGEHLEVSLAERLTGTHPAADEATVRQVLDRLGAPQRVAAAALEEAGVARTEPEAPGRTRLTLLLAALPLPLLLVPALGPLLALAAAAVALLRIWKSPQWTTGQKRQATLLLVSPAAVLPTSAVALSLVSSHGLTPVAVLAACLVSIPLPVLAIRRLASTAAHLRTA
ncbi:hypothetical protein CFP65_0893 [Kitasatospora sp. MMS16-BH015]|uniref:HAAS signaling domain-containing protein n=1 Tax=Kitasatospora sp. MMS16-BH015 TaxID=2018025 RepID=UPI000CA1AEFA|nr:hypothetical protein [Kitasatospora sp. MMS16-BH015]AUG75815.1 hypothetical protein CFP65_0893 [Kitasatospora sp. MMS16-BH015]